MPHATGNHVASTPPDPHLGKRLGDRYLLVERIGLGGMSTIYRAEQQPLSRNVAVKLLKNLSNDPNDAFHKHFLSEAATLAKLSHPNTVRIFDYGHQADEALWYMVMEFVEGTNLTEVLRAEHHFTPWRSLRIAHEISRALREAHARGIFHRDIKPNNVMITQTAEGEAVKVLDFGIAKVMDGDSAQGPPADHVLGSPHYMAPELITEGFVDARTDVYALGVTLYLMLCGRLPFHHSSPVKAMMAHVSDPVPPIWTRAKLDVPIACEAVALRCLQKNPADRFQSVEEFQRALHEASLSLKQGAIYSPTTVFRLPSGMPPVPPTVAPWWRSPAFGVALVVLAGAVLGWIAVFS